MSPLNAELAKPPCVLFRCAKVTLVPHPAIIYTFFLITRLELTLPSKGRFHLKFLGIKTSWYALAGKMKLLENYVWYQSIKLNKYFYIMLPTV
jgi:hypothetical protein